MKNLWTVLPPLLSDNFGFIEVLRGSDGCGIIDDSGDYRLEGEGGGHGRHREGFQGRPPEGRRPPDGEFAHHGGRDFHGGKHGGGHGGKGGNSRVIVSGADSQDIVNGTKDKLIESFERAQERYEPKFALFSAGPCGAMIGTDLDDVADTVSKTYGIPAAAVDLTGQKLYDLGISRTSETIIKLLSQPAEKKAGVINILGATGLDWAAEDISGLAEWAKGLGFDIQAQLGGTVISDGIAAMGKAQVNLVAASSGLAAARYLEREFGTPYVVAAPFGEELCKKLAIALDEGHMPSPAQNDQDSDVLIIGEQLASNAIRETLVSMGAAKSVDVASFFTIERTLAAKGDKKLRGEDDLSALINSGKYRMIIADPLMKQLLTSDCKWIDLPHRAFNTYDQVKGIPLLGSKLNEWLDNQL